MLEQRFLAINLMFVCIISLSHTQTTKRKNFQYRCLSVAYQREKQQKHSLPNLLHSEICQKAQTSPFLRSFTCLTYLKKKNPAQILLLYFHISKTILNISSLDLVLTVLFLPNISFNVELTNYQLDQFVTTSLSSFNRSTIANRMVLQRILTCQPSKSSP